MATLPSKPLGESVDITFDFDNALPVIVRFSLDVSYYQSTVNANLTEPNVSFDGVSFTPVVNNLFDVPAGKKYFIIRARLNNDPFTRVDDSVQVTVVPVTNTHLITNPDGFTAIVELKTVTYKPSISVDAATATVGEGSTAQAVFSFSSGLIFESVFDFKLVFTGTATAADIAALTYKLNGGNAKPLAMSDQITAPVGTSNITINFPVVQDGFNDGVEGAIVSLMEPIYQLHTTTKIPVTKTFTFLDTYVPPNGTLLRYFCTGKDQYAEYADGFGGVYNTLIKKNSVDCGYVIPAAGTLLSQHCAGYDKIGEYADGSDGSYFSIIALEDASCGYVPDAPNPQTELIPTKYDANNKGTTVTLSNGDRNFAGLLRDMSRTVFSAMYGKWYIEHTVLLPTDQQEPTSIGVVTATHPIGNWIGSNINSWAWWPHEGTKFHNDVQGFFGPSLIDGDVVGILLDIQNGSIAFQLNGADIGEMYNSFPAYTKLYFATSALNSSFARTNFGQTLFKYPVPSGYYPGFGEPANAPPPRRTFLNNFCSGVDRWVTMADGKGGSFTEIELKNDPGCGYIPPPDPVGTVIGWTCQGMDLYDKIADGNYGFTLRLVSINSRTCGYVPPPVPAFTPTTLDTNFKSASTTIDANGYQAVPVGTVRTVTSVYSGRWFWEVTSNTNAGLVGITTNALLAGSMLGSNAASYALDLSTGELITNNTRTAYTTPIAAGAVVSMALDFVAGTLSFQVDGVSLGIAFSDLTSTYYAAGSGSGASTLTFNLGNDTQVYQEPQDHISGFGVASTIYLKKGSYISYYCTGVIKNERYADGGGGSYEVAIDKSPTCGYVPPKAAGTVVRTYCVGVDKYTEYNDGNYGVYSTLTEARNLACGYKPAGALISTYCDGYTKIGTYSDGEFGTYIDTIETFSRDCGYNVGSGGSNSETTIDPNLVITADGMILFDTLNNQITGDIVLDVENTRPPPPTYPIADTVLGYSCLGASKILQLANGSGGSYNKAIGWHPDCGPRPYFYDGLPAGYTTIVDSSALNVSSNLTNLSVNYNSSAYNSCFIPGPQPSKTSAKIDIDISYAQYGAANAPAIGFCLITSNNVHQFGLLYAVNSLQYASSGSNGSVAINSVILSGTALSAGALPASGRQLFSLIVEPVSGFLKITMLINGTSVHVFNSNIAATSFTPGIYLRSSAGELFDFSYVDYP